MPAASRSRTSPRKASKGGGGGGRFFTSIVLAVVIGGLLWGFWEVPHDPTVTSFYGGVVSRSHQVEKWVHQVTDPINKKLPQAPIDQSTGQPSAQPTASAK
jgi:hypothetical protein